MYLLRGRYVIPISSPPLADAGVVIDAHRIRAVGPLRALSKQYPETVAMDLSDCALLPGLVNAHTHLELSPFKNQVPYRGQFTDWVRCLRQVRAESSVMLADALAGATGECLAGGTTTVGDISFGHQAWHSLKKRPIRKICFGETFGLTMHIEEALEQCGQWISENQTDPLLRLGLSPHAPYSVGQKLYEAVGRLARQHQLTLTTHLAEQADEFEFLRNGSGPWKDYLKEIHKWDNTFKPPEKTPVNYFLDMNLSDQAVLLAHVNYISDEELDKLAETRHSVAFCPRAHRFFGHQDHPFKKMLKRGINVCLGTDSLASNHSLSMLDEMRFLHENHRDLDPAVIFRMATLNGACALQWQDKIGSITTDKEADLIAIPLQNPDVDPVIDILRSHARPKAVFLRGKPILIPHQNSI